MKKDAILTQVYYRGKFAAYMESISTTAPLTEVRLDEIKEDLSHICEKEIDESLLSDQEKEEQKSQMKQCLEVYFRGAKDELKASKRLQP